MSVRSNRARKPSANGLQGGISLCDQNLSANPFKMFDDDEPDEDEQVESEDDDDDDDSSSSAKENKETSKRGRKVKKEKKMKKQKPEKVAAKSKAGKRGTTTRPTDTPRLGACSFDFCGTNPEVVNLENKHNCWVPCFNDIGTMRRDAKKAGKKAVQYLRQCEAECKQGKRQNLNRVYQAWKSIVGDQGATSCRI